VTHSRGRVTHLATRFAGSLRPHPIPDDDLAWVCAVLTADELAVWEQLGPADRAESVAVGRRAARDLGVDDGPFVAAALLHDVGKTQARLGPVRRSFATVIGGVGRHDRVRGWATSAGGWRRRVGTYIAHDDLGAVVLLEVGARAEAVEWARLHHRRARWGEGAIPGEVCMVLARADGERT
jgi:hypothetical protein